MKQNFIFTFILLITPFVINAVPCYHTPTPPLLNLFFFLSNTSDPNLQTTHMTISQTPEYHIYNDTKIIAEIYSENDVQNKVSEYVFELCAMTNVTCPFTAGNTYSAKAEFQIPVTTKVVTVSVLTEHNQYLGCEIVVLKNITIPTLTTSNPTSTPYP
ncbi:28947_t:CDS:1 [Gigaspora margarita]|uniref:28947_t:CDS:1 n=1 Tax=Gigaspora margarita TaxID=4874 RepID=A0ABN7V173_GIGMA|nr:28947_t:CDS:1 [Gigaspora margarita]